MAKHEHVGLHLKSAQNQLLEIHHDHDLSWEFFYSDYPGQYARLTDYYDWPDVWTSHNPMVHKPLLWLIVDMFKLPFLGENVKHLPKVA